APLEAGVSARGVVSRYTGSPTTSWFVRYRSRSTTVSMSGQVRLDTLALPLRGRALDRPKEFAGKERRVPRRPATTDLGNGSITGTMGMAPSPPSMERPFGARLLQWIDWSACCDCACWCGATRCRPRVSWDYN